MHKQIKIFMVEDNANDVFLTREAFIQNSIDCRIDVASDGVKASEYLKNIAQSANGDRPDFILLDLNLPKKDGREVLKEIKNNDDLKEIPVMILTTSESERDVHFCYQNHANCYLVKPLGMEELIVMIKRVTDFWLLTAKTPEN